MRVVMTILSVLAVCCAAPVWAWQTAPPMGPTYIPAQAPAAPTPYVPAPTGTPNYNTPPAPARQMQPAPPQAYGGVRQGQFPQYPYPKYHNPYFDGMSPRSVVSNTLDWFFTLPANVMSKLSGFMDSTAFPQAPATHGGQAYPGQTPPGQAPSGPAPQYGPSGALPPASTNR